MASEDLLSHQLSEILARRENRHCADCGQNAPRWAAVNLGVFVCIECSGIHRSLGTHISTIKSVSLDRWQPQWIKTMSLVGNEVGNSYYQSTAPPSNHTGTRSPAAMAQWIRAKYMERRYAPAEVEPPAKLVAQGIDPRTLTQRADGAREGARETSTSTTNTLETTAAQSRRRTSPESSRKRWSKGVSVESVPPVGLPRSTTSLSADALDTAMRSSRPSCDPAAQASVQNHPGLEDWAVFPPQDLAAEQLKARGDKLAFGIDMDAILKNVTAAPVKPNEVQPGLPSLFSSAVPVQANSSLDEQAVHLRANIDSWLDLAQPTRVPPPCSADVDFLSGALLVHAVG